ncbi:MAG: DUF1449 family protein [Ilumatobacter sp.]
MGDVLQASVELPTVIFTGLLAVVAGMWLLSLTGFLGFDADSADGLFGDALEPLHLSEVPSTILITIFALAGWFVSVLASMFLLDNRSGTALLALSLIVGLVAALAAAAATAWLAPILGRVFVTAAAPSKRDLIGRVAEIRSTTVTESAGRAEAQWPDGTVSTIDVRVANSVGFPSGQLKKGDRALIVEWLNDTDDFIVDRIPAELAD